MGVDKEDAFRVMVDKLGKKLSDDLVPTTSMDNFDGVPIVGGIIY